MSTLREKLAILVVAASACTTSEPNRAAKLVVEVPPSSETFPGQPFRVQPVLQVADANGNALPLSGVLVTASMNGGDGQAVGNTTALSDANGRAAFAGLSIEGISESQQLQFTHPDLEGTEVTVKLSTLVTIDAGGLSSCGSTALGDVYCWGRINAENFARASRVASNMDSVAVGSVISCGLTPTGAAFCWGQAPLGDGSSSNSASPVPVAGGKFFRQIAAGGNYACGVTATFAASCWGDNLTSQLGNGTSGGQLLQPVLVAGNHLFRTIETGSSHACAITTAGAAYCWGRGFQGQLGDGNSSSANVPVQVAGGLNFSAIAPGSNHTCGLTTSGHAYCWGELFDQAATNEPVLVSSTLTFSKIESGAGHVCALSGTDLFCWGLNDNGQLGNGTTTGASMPLPIMPGTSWAAFGLGNFTTCGVTTARILYCWGMNNAGQVGDGTTTTQLLPTRVRFPR